MIKKALKYVDFLAEPWRGFIVSRVWKFSSKGQADTQKKEEKCPETTPTSEQNKQIILQERSQFQFLCSSMSTPRRQTTEAADVSKDVVKQNAEF